MKRCVSVIFLLFILFSIPALCWAGISKTVKQEIINEFQGKEFVLRPLLNISPFVYMYVDSVEIYYEYDNLSFFKKNGKADVVIEKIDFKNDDKEIEVKLKTDKQGTGKLKINLNNLDLDNSTLEKLKNIINRALYLTSEELKGFVVNKRSGLIHVLGCNHPPDKEDREEYLYKEDALEQGYKLCEICFLEYPDVPDYFVEKELGDYISGKLTAQYPIYYDDKSQQMIQNAGKKVLDGWPFPLKGYKYKFVMLDDEQTNACSCPAGKIFVFKGLMDNVETEEELEMILAHEIAHVELRHGYRTYYEVLLEREGLEMFSVFTTLAAGVAASENQKTAAVLLTTMSLMSQIASEFVFLGYGRKCEEEADLYSLVYLDKRYKEQDRRRFVSILRKLKYQTDLFGGEGAEIFSDHPNINHRVSDILESEYVFFQSNNRFYGVDSKGKRLVELVLLAQISYGEKRRIKFNLTCYDEALVTKDDILRIYAGNKAYSFFRPLGSTTISMNKNVSQVLSYTYDKGIINEPIERIEFPLRGIAQWIKAE